MRSRPNDVRLPEQVIVRLGSGWHCQLCGQPVGGDQAKHHLEHMLELDAWLSDQPRKPTSNDLRSERRRAWRQDLISRTTALGEDPFHHVVVGIDPTTGHRRRRRRVRHPREETEARIRELHAKGRLRRLIAEELHLSDDYVRRVLKRIEKGVGNLEKAPANGSTMRAVSDLGVPRGSLSTQTTEDRDRADA